MIDEAPEPRPGVKPERLNAYLTAKEVAPERNTLPSDLLALAAFLAAVDEEPEKDEEEDEAIGGAEFGDDRADDHDGATEAREGFAPVDGRDEWPPIEVVVRLGS